MEKLSNEPLRAQKKFITQNEDDSSRLEMKGAFSKSTKISSKKSNSKFEYSLWNSPESELNYKKEEILNSDLSW